MRDDLRLHARDKTVQKMTKDGLVEENLSNNSTQNVSSREKEIRLDKDVERIDFRKSGEKASGATRKNRTYQKALNKGSAEQVEDAPKSKKVEKLEEKAEKADEKLTRAKKKIKKKEVIRHQRLFDEQTGRVKHKLYFEEVPKGKPPAGVEAVKSTVSKAGNSVNMELHHKVHQVEKENSGVEAAHHSELAGEDLIRVIRGVMRNREQRLQKKVSKLEHRAEKAHVKLRFQENLEAHPEMKNNLKNRVVQKHIIKREYQQAQKAALKGKKTVGKAGKATASLADSVKSKILSVVKNNKSVIAIVAVSLLIMILCMSALGSCAAVFGEGGGAVSTSTYIATDDDILTTDSSYSALETGLQNQVDNIETNYPGYDEYRYNLDEISHDPYALASYFSAKEGSYKASEVSGQLQGLFNEQYTLTLTPTTETRYRTETRTGYYTTTNPDGTTSTHSYTYTVQVPYDYHILTVTLTNKGLDAIVRPKLNEKQLKEYQIYQLSMGNRSYLFGTDVAGNVASGGINYDIPAEALQDADFRAMITEAEKYLGYPYVWGGSSPSTSFDCSGFVSWVVNHSIGNVGRQTANGLLGKCNYVSASDAKPGDLIFFQGTYNTSGASHVGIYVGNGMMIHCGNPIQYASIETNYWKKHFYCFGRINR